MKHGTSVFVVRGQGGVLTNVFRTNNYIGVSFFNEDPFKYNWDLKNKDFLKNEFLKNHKELDNKLASIYSSQAYRFINTIKIGDYVICPNSDKTLLIGIIESEFYFSEEKSSSLKWRKNVRWLKDRVERKNFSKPLWFALRSSITVFEIKQVDEIIQFLNK